MRSTSPKGIHGVAGGNAPGIRQGERPTLKGSNNVSLRLSPPESETVRPFQGRPTFGSPSPGALPPATESCPFRAPDARHRLPPAGSSDCPSASTRRTTAALRLLDFTASGLTKSGNKARMSMKTKDEVKKVKQRAGPRPCHSFAGRRRMLMRSTSPKGIHRVAGGSAPGIRRGERPTLKGSNNVSSRLTTAGSESVRPFQGRPTFGAPFPGALPPATNSCPCRAGQSRKLENSGNEAKKSLKTKDGTSKTKLTLSAKFTESNSGKPRAHRKLRAAGQMAAVNFSTSGLLNLLAPEFREQSENVYENKGKRQNIHRYGQPGPRYPSFVAHGLTTSRGINEDENWGTFKPETTEILRRPDQIGTPQDDSRGGDSGTPPDDRPWGENSGTPRNDRRVRIGGLLGIAGQRSQVAAVPVKRPAC
jgi:hypothetical protein